MKPKGKKKCKCNTAFGEPNIKFRALDCPVHNLNLAEKRLKNSIK